MHSLHGCIFTRTTDETGGFQDLLLSLFLAPQVSKRVDDDAKDQVENDDDDDEEEQEVVDHSGCKQRLLRGAAARRRGAEKQFKVGPFSGGGCRKAHPYRFGGSPENITHASSVPQTLIQDGDDTHEQCVAHPLHPLIFICSHKIKHKLE